MRSAVPSAGVRSARRAGAVALVSGLMFVVAIPSAAAGVPQPPLRSGAATSTGSWAVLPLGELSSEDNTFWQLLHVSSGSASWSPVTPPGTADNGGLVAGVSGSSAVAGVLPSGLLTFSPLAMSLDNGGTWNAAFVPGAVAHVPDGLALDGDPGGKVLAVVGSRVLRARSAVSSWSTLVSLSTLQRASRACGAKRLQAVAFTPAGTVLVGAQCRHGVGLFTDASGSWRRAGPSLVARSHTAPTSVIRLVSTGSVTTALLATVRSGHTKLVALWQSADGVWSASPLVGVPAAGPVATSVAPTGEITVLVDSSHGMVVEDVAPGTKWVALPAPPRGTVALAPSGAASPMGTGQIDLFTVHGAEFDVYARSPSGTSWSKVQSSQVPLAYGSSS